MRLWLTGKGACAHLLLLIERLHAAALLRLCCAAPVT